MILISPITQMIALNGVAIRMEAGVEQFVRESLIKTAKSHGCVEVGTPVSVDPKPILELQATPTVDAIRLLVEQGNTKDFSKEGLPKVKAVEKILGYDISAADRDAGWAIFQEA